MELVHRLIFGGVAFGVSAAARREVIVVGDVPGQLVVVLLSRYLYTLWALVIRVSWIYEASAGTKSRSFLAEPSRFTSPSCTNENGLLERVM